MCMLSFPLEKTHLEGQKIRVFNFTHIFLPMVTFRAMIIEYVYILQLKGKKKVYYQYK